MAAAHLTDPGWIAAQKNMVHWTMESQHPRPRRSVKSWDPRTLRLFSQNPADWSEENGTVNRCTYIRDWATWLLGVQNTPVWDHYTRQLARAQSVKEVPDFGLLKKFFEARVVSRQDE
jgi:hypothetical protein